MKKTLKFALFQTLPVLFGYLFLGIAFGLLLQNTGFDFLWALLISTFVYAGSMQFVLVSLLGNQIGLFSIALLTLTINSRHIFYGLTFIEKFKTMGKAYPYMVFSLTDETYSLLCSAKVPDNLEENKVFFFMAVFDQLYWITGSVIGAIVGQLITFNSTGIDYAMTALFIVIFVEQWLSSKTHLPSFIGIICGIFCLLVFGPDNFILPSLLLAVGLLTIFKPYIEKKEGIL